MNSPVAIQHHLRRRHSQRLRREEYQSMGSASGLSGDRSASRIGRCRSCSSENLRVLLDLGNLVSCGIFPKADEPDPPALPLTLVQCGACSLVQLAHNFKQDNLFRHNYGYRSGLNEAMISHLAGIVTEICSRIELRAGDVILDIGSNDGTTLGRYTLPGLRKIGIDPTIDIFRQYYQPDIQTVADFFSAKNFRKLVPDAKARVVTSIAMYYDLPDPNAFARDIADILAPDGIWVLEQSYLPSMIERMSFDTICHEHLEYYGLRQIVEIMRRAGLRVIDTALNDANGGSFRVTVCHAQAPYAANDAAIAAWLEREDREGYRGDAPFVRLKAGIEDVKARVISFLTEARRAGQLVHGYGASTKGNTLLQYFGLGPDLIPAIADRNPGKYGCRTPGTNIPIISEAESRAQNPAYYFVLPWHFRDGFIQREQDFLARGGGLVFPLPTFDIVRKP